MLVRVTFLIDPLASMNATPLKTATQLFAPLLSILRLLTFLT